MPTLDSFTPTETQKHIMLLIKTAPTEKVAYENVSHGRQKIAARDLLARLGLIVYDNDEAEVTPEGEKLMQDYNLIDEMGEPTEEGEEIINKHQEEEETKMESQFPLLRVIVEERQLNEMFSPEEITFIQAVVDDRRDFEDIVANKQLFNKLLDYAETEIPYGVRKGRTGMPDEWLQDHLEMLLDEIKFDEKMQSQRNFRSPASRPRLQR